MDPAAVILLMLLIGGGAVIAWAAVTGRLGSDATGANDDASPGQSSKMDLKLSSSQPNLSFDCRATVFWLRQGPNTSNVPDQQIAENAIREAAELISTKFDLTGADRLRERLVETFKPRYTIPGTNLAVWCSNWKVEVDPGETATVEEFHKRRAEMLLKEMESELIDRRIDYLSKTLDDPRRAALWWFAKNEDKPQSLNELPAKAKLLREVDLAMSPWAEETTPIGSRLGFRIGRDLEEFLSTADESGRSAVGVSLSRLYREYGYQELAEHAERLIGSAEDEPEADPDDDSTTRIRSPQ